MVKKKVKETVFVFLVLCFSFVWVHAWVGFYFLLLVFILWFSKFNFVTKDLFVIILHIFSVFPFLLFDCLTLYSLTDCSCKIQSDYMVWGWHRVTLLNNFWYYTIVVKIKQFSKLFKKIERDHKILALDCSKYLQSVFLNLANFPLWLMSVFLN